MLLVKTDTKSKTYDIYLKHKDALDNYCNFLSKRQQNTDDLILSFLDVVSLSPLNDKKIKPLVLDFTKDKLFFRLSHTSKNKEPLARAVLSNIDKDDLIFDATAGLGRDSMILHKFGANLIAFERNVVIYCLLEDALNRAKESDAFLKITNSLPKLHPLGSIDGYEGERPSVIYYDPMFPTRKKSALVKKDMQLFKALIGEDEDVMDYLKKALSLATRKVVLKRPKLSEILVIDNIKPYTSIDGGACRFDCYKALDA